MKFKHGTRRRALEYEKDWVKRWKADKTFEKSVENSPKDNSYVFYDGPPFITGVPHHGTLLSSIVKDAVPRYQTMKGKRVERVWGWDCHGLPAERYTEKKLGIHSREEVLSYGLEKYILACRDNMVQTGSEWEDVVDRIGRWVEFKGAYKTMDKNYMESIWWAFKTLYEKGKIYEGEKVLMYCTLDGTPLSKAEVTMDAGAYQDVTDPSVYVKFKLSRGRVVLLHGKDKSSKDVWYPWLKEVAQKEGYEFASPDLPNTNEPDLDQWMGEINKLELNDTDIVVAHSKGGVALLRFLERNEVKVAGVVLVATNNPELESDQDDSFYKEGSYQYKSIRSRADWFTVLHSRDDQWVSFSAGELNAKGLSAELIAVDGKNHFGKDISGKLQIELPELENIIQNHPLPRKYMLAWTTTPWTLPANTAIAVNKDVTYVEVECDGEHLVVAKDLVEEVFTDEKHKPLKYKVVREFKGEELVGLSYQPLFVDRGENAHKVWHADYVETEAGTGIVHLAPTYGEEDFQLAKQEGFPAVHTIDQNGYFTEGDWEGKNVWEVNKQIAKDLKERGIVWKIDYIRHSYPHCHRCGTKLMYRAHPSWFMDIDGQREKMLEKNEPINWFPAHVKHGRFEKTVQQAPDWNISRDRFWATAMPVWKTESGKTRVVGSYAELKELSGVELEDYHRPWIDDVTFEIDGEKYTRIDKVMDSWFEAGSMPFAQFHYPFENKEKFEENFPGDFIVEYIGQVRAWFYYMHAMSVALFGEHSFKNVIVTGNVAGNDGRKMSKSYGNYTDPNELMDKFSADSLRFLLLSSPLLNGEDFSLQDKEVGDVARKLSMIWNMYDFFTMYAEVDGWEYDGELVDPLTGAPVASLSSDPLGAKGQSVLPRSDGKSESSETDATDAPRLTNPLDIWIVSRVHQLVVDVEQNMDEYNIPDALSPILPFLDDASNWYVRRSRRRFWKSEDDGDKKDAYRTLHYVLVRLAYVLAPFTPFLAEELYRNLTGDEESIHLKDWLEAGGVNQGVMNDMDLVRSYVNEGLSLRAKAGLKVRQPLASVTVPSKGEYIDFESILLDELNVKSVIVGDMVAIDENLTPELKREGMMREVVRHVQAARKKAGLNVDDRIELALKVVPDKSPELEKAIEEHRDVIQAETLTKSFGDVQDGYDEAVSVEGHELRICLKKA